MLDFHTILFPKNSRTSKISRRRKGLNIRIREKAESNTFLGWDSVFRVRQIGMRGTPSPVPIRDTLGALWAPRGALG